MTGRYGQNQISRRFYDPVSVDPFCLLSWLQHAVFMCHCFISDNPGC